MRLITHKTLATLAGATVAFTGIAVLNSAPASAGLAHFTGQLQVQGDQTYLDEGTGTGVLARAAAPAGQTWVFDKVDYAYESVGVFTVKGSTSGKCVTAKGIGQAVVQETCRSGDLTQRWIIDNSQDTTLIRSHGDLGLVLHTTGVDQPVTGSPAPDNGGGPTGAGLPGSPDQNWILYQD
ncbi:RICIN domain-containing protein [Kitasatospora sp. NPDC091335]|uniref:RICIN domain-containing protein n=1 Tax=Kitasatospora sp. NPDC091335 TaxID=3364085 RepID=UPI0038054D02